VKRKRLVNKNRRTNKHGEWELKSAEQPSVSETREKTATSLAYDQARKLCPNSGSILTATNRFPRLTFEPDAITAIDANPVDFDHKWLYRRQSFSKFLINPYHSTC
jgi:hypothetical protein